MNLSKIFKLIFFCIMVFPVMGFAQWSGNTCLNVAVCDYGLGQAQAQIIKDFEKGAFISWVDSRDQFPLIYCQRIDSNGIPLWQENGIIICDSSLNQAFHQTLNDGDSGIFIFWVDQRNGTHEVFGQRLDKNGIWLWDPSGVYICRSLYFTNSMEPRFYAEKDENGGAIIISGSGTDSLFRTCIVAQRIDKNGNLLWPESNNIGGFLDINYIDRYDLISDANGFPIITWQQNDCCPNGVDDFNIYAQKLNSDGNSLWGPNGVVVCNAMNGQFNPKICSDGNSGSYVIWSDIRQSVPFTYFQHLDSMGNTLLTNNGKPIDTIYGVFVIETNIDSGFFIIQENSNTLKNTLYKIGKNDSVLWSTPVPSYTGSTFTVRDYQMVSDTNGGVFITWDENNYGYDVFSQHILAGGELFWGSNGIVVSNPGTTSQENAHLIKDGEGGIIVAWDDYRNGYGDIYAQRIDWYGNLYGVESLYDSISHGMIYLSNADSTYIRIFGNKGLIVWQYSFDSINFEDIFPQNSDSILKISNLTESVFYRAVINISGVCFDTTEVIKIYLSPAYIPVIIISNELVLSPNPSKGMVSLSSNIPKPITIMIINLFGEKIFQNTTHSLHVTIDLSPFPSGMYFCVLQTENDFVTKKIILNK